MKKEFPETNFEETERKTIIRYKNGIKTETNDIVASETMIKITLQCELIGTLSCTPSDIRDLVAGYLISSGIVWEENKLIHIEYLPDKQTFDVSLENNNVLSEYGYSVMQPVGCTSGNSIFIKVEHENRKLSKISLEASKISHLMKEFHKISELFRATGGVHSAALADGNEIIVFREDVGRHNAVDKVFGYLYLNNESIDDKILLTSGRISSEVVMKSNNAGVQIIISRSAPTLKGIELAEKYNITLVGFARRNNFNIYSSPERIDFQNEN
ncbi:MAG: formate dehydrogenase accessory sulfurtransferase FdhD [Bacteroidota bacterium]